MTAVSIVTGSAKDVGKSIVRKLAINGHSVVIAMNTLEECCIWCLNPRTHTKPKNSFSPFFGIFKQFIPKKWHSEFLSPSRRFL